MSSNDRLFELPIHTTPVAKSSLQNQANWLRQFGKACSAVLVAGSIMLHCGGCNSLPSTSGLDLMSPDLSMIPSPGSLLLPPSKSQGSPYKMSDGSVPGQGIAADGSMTMEAYQKIRQAKAQNAVVLQVAGDSEAVRVLPLPEGGKTVFVSELLSQTGVMKKFGAVEAVVYRPSPESISGIRMEVKFTDNGAIDPVCDYGLRPGDRVQVSQRRTTGMGSLRKLLLRR